MVDSFRTVMHKPQASGGEMEMQSFIQQLTQFLTSWEATTFLVGEFSEGETQGNPLFTIADGLFWLSQKVERNSVVRKLQILKVRGSGSVPGLHTVRITDDGLQAFSRTLGLDGARPTPARRSRLSTGIPDLDKMLGGGVLEGDSVLIAGPSGTGKSAMATQFIAEGLSKGEPGIMAIFEERPNGYTRRADTFGLKLQEAEKAGTLEVLYLRPLDLSVDETMQPTVISGRSVSLAAGGQLDLVASSVLADGAVGLHADSDLNLLSAAEHDLAYSARTVRRSGIFGNGGLSITIGNRSSTSIQESEQLLQHGASVGSLAGDILATAGGQYLQLSSDLTAPQGDVHISAQNVALRTAPNTTSVMNLVRQRQSGVTLSASHPVVQALQTVDEMTKLAKRTDNGRYQALGLMTAGLTIYNAYRDPNLLGNPDPKTGAGWGGWSISASVGASQSLFESVTKSTTPAASAIEAGRNVTITATGTGADSGDITAIGDWVLREACRSISGLNHRPDADTIFVSVNVSPHQLLHTDFADRVQAVLTETGLPPGRLRLEITETAIVRNREEAARLLQPLRQLGVQIYIDDFGTGHSALSYVHDLPVDGIKIDRSFVNRLTSTDNGVHLVRAILDLARNLGLHVVAEGIETRGQQDALLRLDCEYGQGYLFDRRGRGGWRQDADGRFCQRPNMSNCAPTVAGCTAPDRKPSSRASEAAGANAR